jgi:hypothetical protein
MSGSNPQAGSVTPTDSKPQNSEWNEYYDSEADALYYYNQKTGEAKWSKPDEYSEKFAFDEYKDEPLTEVEQLKKRVEAYQNELDEVRKELNASTPIWTIHTDDSGKQYYYNDSARESYYDVPKDGIISISPIQLESNENLKNQLEACRTDCNGQYCDKNANSVPPASPTPSVSPVKSLLPKPMTFPPIAPFQMPVPNGPVKNKMTSQQINDLLAKPLITGIKKLAPIKGTGRGGARTRKKRRAFIKRTKSRRKFSNRTKSRRKFNKRTKNKK